MRRIRLIWFALGSGTTGAVVLLSSVLIKPLVFDDTQVAYLVLSEPEREITPESPVSNEDMIAFNAGQILNDCRARGFETTGMYEDHQPTAEFPIIPENNRALECVIKAVRDRNLPFKVEMRWSSAVAKEMRMKR